VGDARTKNAALHLGCCESRYVWPRCGRQAVAACWHVERVAVGDLHVMK
jgi:hypothetical protein